ncbi:MAG: hypothetical protein QXN09_00355, partial [Candidatus Caldarchaeum sp.]
AIAKSFEWGDRIPVGVFYQNRFVPSYEERISANIKDYRTNYPSKQTISTSDGRTIVSLDDIFKEFLV